MSETKEKILVVALHLFAKDGYEAVSVSKIAEKLGITKGALYKHYENKKDIFDSIVMRMAQSDHEIAQNMVCRKMCLIVRQNNMSKLIWKI